MLRQVPTTTSDEIDLYLRTLYSLLRSSGEVRVRALEEAHAYSNSSLHAGALEPTPDVAAFAYSAARLPGCMPQVRRLVLGHSHEHFERAGLQVGSWTPVSTRGRRRPLRWDRADTLAVFITSTSDLDDLVPILVAWQIEWNKLHARLADTSLGHALAVATPEQPAPVEAEHIAQVLGIDAKGVATLQAALDTELAAGLGAIARRPCDLVVRQLAGSFSQFQRAAQRWWSGIEPHYLREAEPKRQPVYFVSSNTHALVNLLGGFSRIHRDRVLAFARAQDPEGLAGHLERAQARGDEHTLANLGYYLVRGWLHQDDGAHEERLAEVQAFDAQSGIRTIETPGRIDVGAQLIPLAGLMPERLDPRLHLPGLERLRQSDAVILNIDYPLGLAAYHHLSRVAQGVGEIRGIYVMGKAATLNARVGDVMVPTVVHDEHSRNTYLFRNAFRAEHVQPYLRDAAVFDTQKALTVRGAFLQNRDYMSVFYREGYTILEMEAGPYLSAVYELVYPNRHPDDQIAHLSNLTPFDLGILHYASDTPYSRRQSLLSKSLSFFGVESTYACAIAILRRIIELETARG